MNAETAKEKDEPIEVTATETKTDNEIATTAAAPVEPDDLPMDEDLVDPYTAAELESALHGMFKVYLHTGSHEVRQLALANARGFCALLGADLKEFFPDPQQVVDTNPTPQGAPTHPGAPRPGWPAHTETRPGFVATQPPVDAAGRPLAPRPHALQSVPGAPGVPTAGGDPRNSSGAEMRFVDGPGVNPGAAATEAVYRPFPRRKRPRR